MKTPDPNHSMQYGPLGSQEDGSRQNEQTPSRDLEPLDALLAEEAAPERPVETEFNDERLYTDEFIRANENASRSLILGFLGFSFLATSLFAWFIFSQPQEEQQQDDAPGFPAAPLQVPSSPPAQIPDVQLDSPSPGSSSPSVPGTVSSPTDESQAPPLVFPASPASPPPSDELAAPSVSTPQDNESAAPFGEGTVPPPPPIAP